MTTPPDEPLQSAAPTLPAPLIDCWLWPLKGAGWAMPLFVAVALLVYDFMSKLPLIDLTLPLVMGLPLAAFGASTVLEAVRASSAGRAAPPDWPDLSDFGELFNHLLLVFAAVAMGTFPSTILRLATDLTQPWQPPVYWALLILFAGYVPACLLGVALAGTLDGVDPREAGPRFVRLLRRRPAESLVAWALVALLVGVANHAARYLGLWIPHVGAAIQGGLMFYLALVVARLSGRLHAADVR